MTDSPCKAGAPPDGGYGGLDTAEALDALRQAANHDLLSASDMQAAVPVLIDRLSHAHAPVRWNAIQVLRVFRSAAMPAVPALEAELAGPLRAAAFFALAEIDPARWYGRGGRYCRRMVPGCHGWPNGKPTRLYLNEVRKTATYARRQANAQARLDLFARRRERFAARMARDPVFAAAAVASGRAVFVD